MYSSMQFGASAYARVGVETSIVDANPHRLIVMLYEGARSAIAIAQMQMQAGNVAEKGAAITKAINIISGGLRDALNMEAGGQIAARLASLYDYMIRRLFQANVDNNTALLAEVDGLLATLEEAWLGILPSIDQPAPAPAQR
jgi:flagellar protein FliS